MKSVNFCFATHNHQPIGNFDHIIEEAYQKSYLPFFELARKHSVRFGTHFTGILLDWLKAHHPEHIANLKAMVASGQLEMISGGFYEPILSVIPPHDQRAQINRLTSAIKQMFGYDASGMWLAERVWEQPLAGTLHEANIRYVLLDDTHFLAAGLHEDDLNGYYLTEDQGKTLAVFPISKALRYTIPFANVDETIAVLKDAASESGDNVVCFADDGEKFGVWPRTYDHVYGEGWLEEFFTKLEENSGWVRTMHHAEAVVQLQPKGRIYLPNASYSEMMQWALPSAESNQDYEDFVHTLEKDKEKWAKYMTFVRGGYWRNFFAKYPETNHLHKHMLRTSTRLAALGGSHDEIAQSLLESQCNDPYWHGVFGGAYLTNLRHANYTSLVRADRLLDEAEGLTDLRETAVDLDCDGHDEVIVESREFSIFTKPSSGGSIVELDYKPRNFNATNSISRQKEAYHAKLEKASDPKEAGGSKSIHDLVETKEEGLEKVLAYDTYRHGCLIDHLFKESVTTEEFRWMAHKESGDFVTSPYEWSFKNDVLEFSRLGSFSQDGNGFPVRVWKQLKQGKKQKLKKGQLEVTYRVTNESAAPLRFRFGSEWMFNLLAGDAHDRYYESDGKALADPMMRSIGEWRAKSVRLVDEYLRLAIRIDAQEPTMFWRVPIESVSLSEGGFERVFQGSIVMPLWDLELSAGSTIEKKISVTFEEL